MKPSARHRWLLAILAALLAGCGDDAATTPASIAVDAGVDAGTARPRVRLLVDANRDGTVSDTGDDEAFRASWDASHGAVFLANVDDDDDDDALDGADDVVNGEADALDLARVRVAPMPGLAEGATGRLTLTAPTSPTVRVFRVDGGVWRRVDLAAETLSTADLRAGVELGVESSDFPTATWAGEITLALAVTRGDEALGDDRAVLRVAPFVVSTSLDEATRVYATGGGGIFSLARFINDLDSITSEDRMEFETIDGLDPDWSEPNQGPDVWTQDYMELGWTAMPGGEAPRGMNVVLRTPRVDRAIAAWTRRDFVGPDRGYVWRHEARYPATRAHDPSLDSFGNLEVIPPYAGHPFGRIFHGNVAARSSDPELRAFLNAQRVQGPVLELDTSWLHVGHVDEFASFIPVSSPRGWKLLVASPRAARAQLQALVAADPANGERVMFEGQHWFYPQGHPMEGRAYAAARTINSILADTELMAFNQRDQAHIDMIRETLQTEAGLTDAEIIEIPFLMWEIENGQGAAYMPGTVNLLLYGHSVTMAKPHAVVLDGADFMQTHLGALMRAEGITAHFAEQWDILHAAEGEVHCGTNALRRIPAHGAWWEVTR
jgi:protein-arginine deiminase